MGLKPVENMQDFYEEFQNETPRAAVILAAAFLDEHLRLILANFFINNSRTVDRLLDINSSLGTFGDRINISYCLGLISKKEFQDLQIIQEIRNEFAHRLHDISFDDEEIVDACKKLNIPRTFREAGIPIAQTESHRDLFLLGFSMLASQIGLRVLTVERERRERLS